jgi:hypothetical protein
MGVFYQFSTFSASILPFIMINRMTLAENHNGLFSFFKDVFPSEHRQQKGFTEWISSTNQMQAKDRDLTNLTSKP